MKPTFTQNGRILSALLTCLILIFFCLGLVWCFNLQEMLKNRSVFSGKERGVEAFSGKLEKWCLGHEVSWVFRKHFVRHSGDYRKTLKLIGGLCGKMKCFQSRVRIRSVYAKDAKLQKYTESLKMLLNMGKKQTLSSLVIKQLFIP